jgi:hypothetical protein
VDRILQAAVDAVVLTIQHHPTASAVIFLLYVLVRLKEAKTPMPKPYHRSRRKAWFILINVLALNVGRLRAFYRISKGLPL